MAPSRRSAHAVVLSRCLGRLGLAFSTLLAGAPALAQIQLGPWSAVDLGTPAVTQSVSLEGDCLHAHVKGGDILGEQTLLIHQGFQGDGALEIHLKAATIKSRRDESISVMFRNSLEPQARSFDASLRFLRPHWQPLLRFRDVEATHGELAVDPKASILTDTDPPETWLRVERQGQRFKAFSSRDGLHWRLAGERTFTLPLSASLLAGVAIAAWQSELTAEVCDLRFESSDRMLPEPIATVEHGAAFVGEAAIFDGTASLAGIGANLEYLWDFDDGEAASGVMAEHVYRLPGSYRPTLTVRDESGRSAEMTFPLEALERRQVDDWSVVALLGAGSGDVTVNGDCVTTAGRGSDIPRSLDTSVFTHRQVRGDFRISARVESVLGLEPAISIGLMARDSLGGGARFGFAMLHNERTLNARTKLSYGFGWRSRYAELESSILRDSPADPAPLPPSAWVQLERSGDELLGYYSENGSEWVLVASQPLDPSPPETLFVGVGCTFHCDGTPLCIGEVEVKMCEVQLERAVEPGRFRRGDVDSNAHVNLTDAVFLVNHLFLGAPGPACEDSADANDDGKLDLTDAIVIVNHLFKGGPALPRPGIEACGKDGEVDGLRECQSGTCE